MSTVLSVPPQENKLLKGGALVLLPLSTVLAGILLVPKTHLLDSSIALKNLLANSEVFVIHFMFLSVQAHVTHRTGAQ